MDYNPYATPQAGGPAAGPAPASGHPQPWTAGQVLSLAWQRYKDCGPVLVLAYFLSTLITLVASEVPNLLSLTGAMRGGVQTQLISSGLSLLAGQVAGAFFQVGLIRIWLEAARGRTPDLGLLFSGADLFLPMLGLNLLMWLAIACGFLLFIVPGVILLLGLFAAQFYLVDAAMGPVDAMKASYAITSGQRGEIAVLGLAGFGLGLLGVLMCCVGLLATVPLYGLATAVAFTRMSGRDVAAQPYPPG